jgi:hypothetical protein
MSNGWQGVWRIHRCLLHLKIQDGKIWIERDGTEHGIANELVAAGVPRCSVDDPPFPLSWTAAITTRTITMILPTRNG